MVATTIKKKTPPAPARETPIAVPQKMAYAWRPGFTHKVSAEVAYHEIERVKKSTGDDSVRPGDLVDASREPEAPLHPEFEWDDAVAAEEIRKDQARGIINSVRLITVEEQPEPVEAPTPRIAFVSTVVPNVGRAYVSTERAMSEEALREQVLRDAVHQLQGVRARFGHLEELAKVSREIDRLADSLRHP